MISANNMCAANGCGNLGITGSRCSTSACGQCGEACRPCASTCGHCSGVCRSCANACESCGSNACGSNACGIVAQLRALYNARVQITTFTCVLDVVVLDLCGEFIRVLDYCTGRIFLLRVDCICMIEQPIMPAC